MGIGHFHSHSLSLQASTKHEPRSRSSRHNKSAKEITPASVTYYANLISEGPT
uniref:Uncharacterized protein n=1 Tax=Medicago truncatula TaxID=3880 RepID=A2Q5X1_MEDTR|nr:hypothetical protein MtrDRAFT_AC171534g6v1 [Medicago truncatula]